MKDTKMIRIVSRGFVMSSRGRILTPIMSPYRESISRIWSMITSDRADVEEKLPDGTFIKLNAQNFDKDNFVSKEIRTDIKPEVNPSKPVETFKNVDAAPVKEEIKEEPTEDKVEEKVEEVKVEETTEVTEEVKEEQLEESKEEVEEPVKEEETEEKVEEVKEVPHNVNNGEKKFDPRNKKNRNKNNNQNRNNQNNESITVDAEEVE